MRKVKLTTEDISRIANRIIEQASTDNSKRLNPDQETLLKELYTVTKPYLLKLSSEELHAVFAHLAEIYD